MNGRFLWPLFALFSLIGLPAWAQQASENPAATAPANRAFGAGEEAAAENEAKPEGDAVEVKAAKRPSQKIVLDPALQLLDPRVYRLKLVIKVEAPDSAATNVVATGPVPMDWPEQRIRLLSEKITSGARVSETVMKGQCAMLKLTVNTIPKGGFASVERLYELTRYRTEFKLGPDDLKLPKGPPSELREQLTGQAPGLEMQHPKMIELHETLAHQSAEACGWDKIKTYWSWTRDNVKFQNGDFRGALFAIENKCGDCEEMSALFISLCRLSGGVARTVWVEGHDYPEFYLVDKKGQGHWIPAQVVGPPWFGEIIEYRPIFQKGDRFYDPLQKQYVRYAPQTVRADGGGSPPKLIVEHTIIADSDINGPSYNNPK
jgi:hypothetical protein